VTSDESQRLAALEGDVVALEQHLHALVHVLGEGVIYVDGADELRRVSTPLRRILREIMAPLGGRA
jgi:hypothetical protein